ncbi:unnamed protein product [Nippostrongylus brasiliensis]|uniref:Sulfotransfer_1 domain-containing protein n=1 Tax=Nippostrongylus brasiliensis TaxID=27835 RepID=A0A0N4YHZ9_NIPBR|nr:unnamed protein product [Nippostrongylus brasiliensis]
MRSHRRKLEIYHQIKNGTYDTAPFEKSSLMPPFYSFSEKFLISPRYKISQCLIEKVISTITEAIFCYIDNPVEFEANNRTISTESYEIRFCEERHQRSSALAARDAVGRDRIEFALVRDPIDRFLSGFVDKCIKYCNFGNNYPDYFILKYEHGAEGVAQVAEKFREIFKKAQLPEHMRQKIYDEMMSHNYCQNWILSFILEYAIHQYYSQTLPKFELLNACTAVIAKRNLKLSAIVSLHLSGRTAIFTSILLNVSEKLIF